MARTAAHADSAGTFIECLTGNSTQEFSNPITYTPRQTAINETGTAGNCVSDVPNLSYGTYVYSGNGVLSCLGGNSTGKFTTVLAFFVAQYGADFPRGGDHRVNDSLGVLVTAFGLTAWRGTGAAGRARQRSACRAISGEDSALSAGRSSRALKAATRVVGPATARVERAAVSHSAHTLISGWVACRAASPF
ncbi:hypothetical protein [Streptomyces sp. NPDC002779]|uniref:hypothetical protein n=1 Tax=Streptomyces sp. NPDC002779 TaxID=3364664 RepID=UPI0036CF820C